MCLILEGLGVEVYLNEVSLHSLILQCDVLEADSLVSVVCWAGGFTKTPLHPSHHERPQI